MNFSASGDYNGEGRVAQHSVIMAAIDRMTFHSEDVVLDVGCGTGEETVSIATKVKRIIGVDLSVQMIAEAQERSSPSNVSFCVGDALTVGDNQEWRESFDKVVSFSVLHWVQDKRKALASILACLKPKGEALIVLDNDTSFFADASRFLQSHDKWGTYVKDVSVPLYSLKQSVTETQEMMSTLGWTNCKCEIVTHEVCMDEVQSKLFFKTVMQQTALIPQDSIDEFLTDLWTFASSSIQNKEQDCFFKFKPKLTIIHAFK